MTVVYKHLCALWIFSVATVQTPRARGEYKSMSMTTHKIIRRIITVQMSIIMGHSLMNDWTRILLMNNMWRSIYSIQNPDIEWLNRFTYLWFDFEKCFCICFLKRLIKQNSSLIVQVSFSRYQLPRYTYNMSQREKKNSKKTPFDY